MERHKCKLCMRSFSNGRALGGHMRSHMMNLPIHQNPQGEEEDAPVHDQMLIDEIDSVSASSSSDDEEGHGEEEEEEEDEEGLYYGLRENPKRSIRLVDPEFSFAVESGSVVLQDRESETESSKNPTRRRSKRTRKSAMFDHLQHHDHQQLHNQYHHHHPKLNQHHQEAFKKIKLKNKIDSCANNNVEPEPVSSISDATTEEDVAFCLMMLSRDKWKKQDKQQQQEEQDDQDEDVEVEYRSLDESDESEEQLMKFQRTKSSRGKYKCETCNKVFKSYQALGGHRASHKKIKAASAANPNPNRIVYEPEPDPEINHNAGSSSFVKTHECPVCFRVFSSGQALGGHKRSHVTGSAAINYTHHHTPSMKSLAKLGDNMIDLNLPAPVDDDEMSQIELSAVSDAEFVNPIRR